MHFLGIDFGTTKTLAARWDERTQSARTIRLGRGSDAIPTTLYCDDKGEFQFGDDADDMRALDAAGWKGRIKRDLGKGASIVLQGKSYKVVHLASRFLGYVRRRVEKEVFHGKIDHTVITVPALYGPSERSELIDAAKKAGFKSVELVDEPVAAGRAFLHDKAGTELGDQVLVFDWGGGTLDLALVEQRDGVFHLNHDWVGGEKNLGGEDIDDAMIEEADRRYAESHGLIDEQEDRQQMHIRRNLKEGKELLSRRAQHKFLLPYARPQSFVWSRVEFEELTAVITDKAIDCLRNHVQKIHAKGIKPDQVLLVGGSSNMPVVKRQIETELGLKALFWENSQTAVALGSATASSAKEDKKLATEDKSGPAKTRKSDPRSRSKNGKESYEVECPHCDGRVVVAGDGVYVCPYCAKDIVFGDVNSEDLRKPKKRSSPQSKKKPTGPKKFTRENAKTRKEQTQLTAVSTAKKPKNPFLVDTLRALESSGPILYELTKKIFGF
ncbi:Hsp70 family protein [Prosthecobacter sp.]